MQEGHEETFHPWHYLRDVHPEVTVWHTTELPTSILGITDGHNIWLQERMTQAERRCTLMHELIHIERGHQGCQPPAIEAKVEDEVARYLIPISALCKVLPWARNEDEAAEELWVDVATLRARLASLTVEEVQILRESIDP